MGAGAEAPAAPPRGPRAGLLLAAVLGLVTLAYSNVFSVPFLWDDHHLIESEPRVREPQPTLDYLRHTFWSEQSSGDARAYYRPLITLSYTLDYRLWNGRPAGFHLTNLLLHLACCALVFVLCRRGGAPPGAAALAAGLFGTFPRLTESVTWISGRTDLTAATAVLAALVLHRSEPEALARRTGAAALLFLGLLGKEVAAAGVAAVAVLEALRARQTAAWGRALRNAAPALTAMAAYALLRAAAAAVPESPDMPLAQRAVFALQALGTYAWMLLDPLRPRLQIGALGVVEPAMVALGAVVAAALGLLAVRALRGPSPVWPVTAALLAGTALLPVLHLLPISLNVLAADRFLYLPVAGLAVALACTPGPRGARVRRGAIAIGVTAGLAFAGATHLRNLDYQDELELWREAVRHAPRGNPQPHFELATQLARRNRPEEALAHYRRALEIQREHGVGVSGRLIGNLALVLSELGSYEEAIALLRPRVQAEPNAADHHVHLGAVYARALDLDAAERELAAALELKPEDDTARRLLQQVRVARERYASLPPPREDEPVSVVAARAEVYAMIGRLRDAAALYREVAAAPGASAQMLRDAASFLAQRGDRKAAQRAMSRLRHGERSPRAGADRRKPPGSSSEAGDPDGLGKPADDGDTDRVGSSPRVGGPLAPTDLQPHARGARPRAGRSG